MSQSRREVLHLGAVKLGVERAVLPNGVQVELAVIRHPGAAAVVALDDQGRVAMLRQYRHAIATYLWEIPAGCREPGEDGRQCAERELREEAGLVAAQWHKLGAVVTIPSFCDEVIELYQARELTRTDHAPEYDEVFELHWIELDRVLAMVRSGEVSDAKTVAALHHVAAIRQG